MRVVTDDLLVAAFVEFRQFRDTFADGAQFVQYPARLGVAVTHALQTFAERLMDGGSLADPLAARQLVGEGDGCGVF